MVVYVEYAVADNLFLDYVLLRAALCTVCVKQKKWKIFVAAAVGTAFALLLPLLRLGTVPSVALKLAVAALMVWISVDAVSKKTYVLALAAFLGYTFFSGGLITGMFAAFSGTEANALQTLPVGVIAVLVYLAVRLFVGVVRRVTRRRRTSRAVLRCVIESGDARVEVQGLLDSGNALYDPKSKRPVIVVSRALASRFFNGFSGRQTPARFLEFTTLSGKSKMLIFEIDRLLIYHGQTPNIIERVTVGLSPNHFTGGEQYDVILHPALMEGTIYV